jgi:hypothetical protein
MENSPGGIMKSIFRTSIVYGLFLLMLPMVAIALPPISEQPSLNEFLSSAFQLPDNRICAVFENNPNLTAPVSKAQIYSVCLKDKRFTKARQLQATEAQNYSYFANPRPLIVNGKIWIYFNAFNETTKEAKWGRFAFDEEDPETPVEWLNTSEVLNGQSRAWIYPARTDSGQVLLSYEKRNSSTGKMDLFFSLSAKGQSFGAPLRLAESAQMVRFAEFYQGPWAFSFQVGSGRNMAAYAMLSADQGQSFSNRIKLSDESDVHDTFLLQRKDGEVDAYYLVGFEGKGYALFRRKISRDGKLGPEQQLTSTAVAVEKPHCLRLNSGKIFVTLSKMTLQTSSVTTDIVFMTLFDDASE